MLLEECIIKHIVHLRQHMLKQMDTLSNNRVKILSSLLKWIKLGGVLDKL